MTAQIEVVYRVTVMSAAFHAETDGLSHVFTVREPSLFSCLFFLFLLCSFSQIKQYSVGF